ncbi:hypothetical protein [Coralloluteibacterium thermophilus]|uniref:Uncharacterized protein n=1 Tax=Coralloluteibacterium thermophilum TaxID=2707049 RepID=A0ABV9NJ56_9GAMM
MGILRTAAVAAIGVAAYRAWQRRQPAERPAPQPDEGTATPPHGDPQFARRTEDAGLPLRTPAQSSQGFGGP